MSETANKQKVVIVGGGFTGLSAAYELAKAGVAVTVLERDSAVGGLAGSFNVGGQPLEKFYHHWFSSDRHVMDLIDEIGQQDRIIYRATRTGMYYANNIYRLSSPMDLLRFKALGLIDRIRLGLMVFKARKVKDWRQLEDTTAVEWLKKLGGESVYRVVWEPLLRGKFGPYANDLSAVWIWNKLVLRGGSRNKGGGEILAYYRGGFAALADAVAEKIKESGGEIHTNAAVKGLRVENGKVTGVQTDEQTINADRVILTTSLPISANWLSPYTESSYIEKLRSIDYLANICLVFEMDRSLSDTYWLNVNDPSFPFVGLIEHTNFEPPETYAGKHIVYLSKYLPHTDELYTMSDEQAMDYCVPFIQKMFPQFDRAWINKCHVWRARYSQPVVGKRYSERIPDRDTPIAGVHLATMAQIYPEDRGTSYAIREGRKIGVELAAEITSACK